MRTTLSGCWATRSIELHAVELRFAPPPDSQHITDVVLRARRR